MYVYCKWNKIDDSLCNFEKVIFLGRWALGKMFHNFDKSSYVISFYGSYIILRHWLQWLLSTFTFHIKNYFLKNYLVRKFDKIFNCHLLSFWVLKPCDDHRSRTNWSLLLQSNRLMYSAIITRNIFIVNIVSNVLHDLLLPPGWSKIVSYYNW